MQLFFRCIFKLKNFFIFIFSIFFSLSVMASVAQTSALSLDQLLGNVRTLQATFSQRVVDLHGNIINDTHGKLALMRPGKFRWETQGNDKQTIVADGKSIWIYEPDLAQVTVRPFKNLGADMPALLLSSKETVTEKNFTVKMESVTQQESQQALKRFLLIPKDKNSTLTGIRLVFKKGVIDRMEFSNYLNQTTLLQFHAVKMNQNLPLNLFKFNVPKGVDVVRAS